mmetsp:Transcript_23101/g.46198  ORF Transcript_23101/g.46198 Transcript_23101/m.46198 type:complete len:616 (-) Transcript_23101:58-1905(-)
METHLRNRGDRMPERTTPMGLEPDDDGNVDESNQLHYGNNDEDFSHTLTQHQPAAMHFSKSSLRSRWLVLALTCTVMTASYYSYDIPSALHQQLSDYMPQSSNFERNFNLLYTVYSIPNVILPLFGGNFVDRYGAPQCLLVFASIVCCGSVLLSIGVSNKSWEVMYLGRFVFGLGAESLCVAQSTITSDWFEGKDIAFAMGIGLSISRLGSIFNNITSPKVANSRGGIQSAFWIGPVLTFSSLFAAALIIFVDRRAIKKLKKRGGDVASTELTEALLDRNENNNPCSESDEVHLTDFRKFGIMFWLLTISCFVVYGCVLPFNNVAAGILLERNYYKPAPSSCHLLHPDQCTSGYLQNGTNNPSLSDSTGALCSIDPSQAPLLPSSVNITSSASDQSGEWDNESYVYPNLTTHDVQCNDPFWYSACTSDYCTKESASTERAGKVMSIPYLISALSSPPLGLLVDKIGRRAQIASLASGLLFIVHLTMAVSHSSPVLPLVGQGIAYSCYAAVIWPSVPLTVDKKFTGTAFGVITSVQNIGLALFPLMIASIYKASGNSYIPNVEFLFMSCAGLGVLIGLLLNRLDRRNGGKLNGITSDDESRADTGFANVEDEYFSP